MIEKHLKYDDEEKVACAIIIIIKLKFSDRVYDTHLKGI